MGSDKLFALVVCNGRFGLHIALVARALRLRTRTTSMKVSQLSVLVFELGATHGLRPCGFKEVTKFLSAGGFVIGVGEEDPVHKDDNCE